MSQTAPDSPGRLLSDIQRLLRLHQGYGLTAYPRSPELAAFLASPATPAPAAPAARHIGPVPSPRPQVAAPKLAQAVSPLPCSPTLAEIEAEADLCQHCPGQRGSQRPLFGVGHPQARLVLIGDFPSLEDEAAAAPFSGEAEGLLVKMLKAIGLELAEVYRTTVVKCRPLGPEAPSPEQIQACLPLLSRQIAAIAPTVLCAMGPLAAQALLRSTTPLIRLRGKFHDYQGLPLMPTFHPAFLLKNEEMKRATWIDLQLIQARLTA